MSKKGKTIQGFAMSAQYLTPNSDEARISIRIRRKAPKGSPTDYGNTFLDLVLEVPPYICRDLVQAVRGGLVKIKENKASALRSAESWMSEIEKAARS